ncbi:trypsin-like cysteine/serine peptidase domain-containing protein, partial [Immersiella caudata]
MPNLGQPATAGVVGAESHFTLEASPESVMDPDLRSVVDRRDFADGGKYRSVPGYAMGTGWLISPDTVVTAGHNVFDWSGFGKGLGKAVQIKCYIGYQGAASVNSPDVQFRLAKNIITTPEWITGRENRHRDVSFIQVDRPFTGDLRIFRYEDTPAAEDDEIMLGVVGYPGDMSIIVNNRRERGAEMYEMFAPETYSLSGNRHGNPLGLLEYRVSTYGGQSGAPVIRKDAKGMTVIGTHVYAAGTRNQASVIGPLGNDYKALLQAF